MKSPVATALKRRFAKKKADVSEPVLTGPPTSKPEIDPMKEFPMPKPFGGKKPLSGK